MILDHLLKMKMFSIKKISFKYLKYFQRVQRAHIVYLKENERSMIASNIGIILLEYFWVKYDLNRKMPLECSYLIYSHQNVFPLG